MLGDDGVATRELGREGELVAGAARGPLAQMYQPFDRGAVPIRTATETWPPFNKKVLSYIEMNKCS